MKKPDDLCSSITTPLVVQPLGGDEIGQLAPNFALTGIDDRNSLKEFGDARILNIIFTANHFPTAQFYEDPIIQLVKDYRRRGRKPRREIARPSLFVLLTASLFQQTARQGQGCYFVASSSNDPEAWQGESPSSLVYPSGRNENDITYRFPKIPSREY